MYGIRGCRRHGFSPWVEKIPWRRKWQLTPVFLPGKSMDRGAWLATVHGVARVGHDLVTKQLLNNMVLENVLISFFYM